MQSELSSGTPAPTLAARPKPKKRTLFVMLAAIVAVGVGTGLYLWGVDDRAALAASEATVLVTPESFGPETIKIAKGQSITWANDDEIVHQLEGDQSGVQELNAELGAGDSFNFTFEEAGTYTYHDPLNPDKFKGTVIVE